MYFKCDFEFGNVVVLLFNTQSMMGTCYGMDDGISAVARTSAVVRISPVARISASQSDVTNEKCSILFPQN